MKLQQYLLREAKVKQTNADVFEGEYTPVFMYNHQEGLLWAVPYPNEDDLWDIYSNSKKIRSKVKNTWVSGSYTHPELMQFAIDVNTKDWIKGRISPDGKTIYIHDLKNRHFWGNPKQFEFAVNKTVDAVYRYMKDYVK